MLKDISTMKPITSEIDNLILIYAVFDQDQKQYELNYYDLPEHEQENLVSLILVHDPDLGYESLGADNALFEKFMVPSLVQLLKNSSDKDNQIEFIDTWKNNIKAYFANKLNQIIQDRLYIRLEDD